MASWLLPLSVVIAMMSSSRADVARPRCDGAGPYLEPMVLSGQDLDFHRGQLRLHYAGGLEIRRCPFESLGGGALRLGATLDYLDFGGDPVPRVLGVELDTSYPIRFGRIGANVSLGSGEINRHVTFGARYRISYLVIAAELAWEKHDDPFVSGGTYHVRNFYVGAGLGGRPGVITVLGVVLLVGLQLVERALPRT